VSVAAPQRSLTRAEALAGCLLGTAVGDALGLPYEGLSPRRAERLYGPPDRYRLLLGRGMVSDDTEHACLTAQALIGSGLDEERFAQELARRLRWWLLGLPAGVGRATLRAGIRLWMGFGPGRSGVYSAGNGPAMRAAVIGAAVEDLDRLRALIRISTRLTHTDPRAEAGALAVAIAARMARRVEEPSGEAFLAEVARALGSSASQLTDRLGAAVESVARGGTPREFAGQLGLSRGVTGYINDTVPVVVHAWLRSPRDFRTAVTETIRCGGDADTTAALVGGIVGAAVGANGIPAELLGRMGEWPRTVGWMRELAAELDEALAVGGPRRAPRLPVGPLLLRNLTFVPVVLGHGFYRLRPW
jgi:ADP-ribosylglycohydrolase